MRNCHAFRFCLPGSDVTCKVFLFPSQTVHRIYTWGEVEQPAMHLIDRLRHDVLLLLSQMVKNVHDHSNNETTTSYVEAKEFWRYWSSCYHVIGIMLQHITESVSYVLAFACIPLDVFMLSIMWRTKWYLIWLTGQQARPGLFCVLLHELSLACNKPDNSEWWIFHHFGLLMGGTNLISLRPAEAQNHLLSHLGNFSSKHFWAPWAHPLINHGLESAVHGICWGRLSLPSTVPGLYRPTNHTLVWCTVYSWGKYFILNATAYQLFVSNVELTDLPRCRRFSWPAAPKAS